MTHSYVRKRGKNTPPHASALPPRARRYIEKGFDKAGTAVKLVVRGKQNDATVEKMPFVPTPYYKEPAAPKK